MNELSNDEAVSEIQGSPPYESAHSSQKQPDDFDEILQAKAYLGKYLMEKC